MFTQREREIGVLAFIVLIVLAFGFGFVSGCGTIQGTASLVRGVGQDLTAFGAGVENGLESSVQKENSWTERQIIAKDGKRASLYQD